MTIVTANRLAELLGDWRRGGPAAERLAASVRALVLDGRVPLGGRLPAERTVAAGLGLSRATVTQAYDRLRSEGYIASRQGAGSWVTIPRAHGPATGQPDPAGGLDLRVAALPAPALLSELAGEAARELTGWLDHHGYDPLGLPPLRSAIASLFTERGLPTEPEEILVTNGALHALDLAIRALAPRGGNALVEIPSYPAALDALRGSGARLRAVPVTADGWDLETLEATARLHQPAVAYLIPDFQNPTGALVDEATRARAARALAQAGTHVIVDETFVELNLDAPRMPQPFAAWAGPGSITVGSLSKSVWGGLRIGWARADPVLIRRLADARASSDMASPVLEQLLGARVIAALPEIVADRREIVRLRRDALHTALRSLLPDWRYTQPAGGLSLWAELPARGSTSLSVLAAELGIALAPGPRFGAAGLLERFVRLPYSLPPDELTRAVELLAQAWPLVNTQSAAPAGRHLYVA
jgi:DNA-binding transcriptional MocR family regulator